MSLVTWQPDWTDVNFDHAAADDAAGVLRAAARRIEGQVSQRAVLVADADRQWNGGHREAWFDTYERLQIDATELVARLRANAATIDVAADAAAYEQHLREQQRADWLRLQELQRRRETGAPGVSTPVVPDVRPLSHHVGLL